MSLFFPYHIDDKVTALLEIAHIQMRKWEQRDNEKKASYYQLIKMCVVKFPTWPNEHSLFCFKTFFRKPSSTTISLSFFLFLFLISKLSKRSESFNKLVAEFYEFCASLKQLASFSKHLRLRRKGKRDQPPFWTYWTDQTYLHYYKTDENRVLSGKLSFRYLIRKTEAVEKKFVRNVHSLSTWHLSW